MKCNMLYLRLFTVLTCFCFVYNQSSAQSPPNDLCTNATLIIVTENANYQTFDLTDSSNESNAQTNCADVNNDIWFQFSVPATESISISTRNIDIPSNNIALSLYESDCSNLVEIYCFDNGNGDMPEFDDISLSGYNGTTLLLRVYDQGSILDEGEFELSIHENNNVNSNEIIAYEYWIDNAAPTYQTISPGAEINIEESLEIPELNDGVHSAHIRFFDLYGSPSATLSNTFLCRNNLSNEANTIVSYDYWMDDDFENRQSISISQVSSFTLEDNIIIPESTSPGFHRINFQFKDTFGVLSSVLTEHFYVNPEGLGNSQISALEYWFDDDYSEKLFLDIDNVDTYIFSEGIPTEGILSTGFHTVHFRFQDDQGKWSSPLSQMVIVDGIGDQEASVIVAYEYWIDSGFNNRETIDIQPSANVTIETGLLIDENLEKGFHQINLRFKDDKDKYTGALTQFFSVGNQSENALIDGYEYWFGNDFENRISIDITPTDIFTYSDIYDMSQAQIGINKINVRFKDNYGKWSSTLTRNIWYNGISAEDSQISGYEYWFNDDFDARTTVNTSSNDVISIDGLFATEDLSSGFNKISFRFISTDEKESAVISKMFFKEANSDLNHQLDQYTYWFNDDFENAQIIDIDPKLDEFLLEEPVLTDSLAEGDNTIHILFRDDQNRWSGVMSMEFNLVLHCMGDFNGDLRVNVTDLLIFLGDLNCFEDCGITDLNNNGYIDVSDLQIFLTVYGNDCY